MSHRIQNDVGYKKKIYPMSRTEDDGFCHYCGRKPNITLRLEWDHVPALNVKIPEGCESIRKTLIRACRECNGLASDIPHMDYLDRHYWLKGAYLRRYKRFLLNDGGADIDTSHMNGFLLAAISNAEYKYEEILSVIGFGIRSIYDIESPILELKTVSKKKLSSVIIKYLHSPIDEDDDEDDEQALEQLLETTNELQPI
ncbi:hypothetical protein QWY77_06130 [Thalassotalea ponticola]|uniref:hypothetical protein n=1 Tax=Thalassotalea ponticola TaxID=1523392 RepID=UPI0025B3413D|nr:hypothetical protein [Thalassotalea ponticola]MDN3652338.1 hypothetical protein [Thalassotalea ponticola]